MSSSKKTAKSKKEEALAFLDDLDNLEAEAAGAGSKGDKSASAAGGATAARSATKGTSSGSASNTTGGSSDRPSTPKKSNDSSRPPRASADLSSSVTSNANRPSQEDQDASEALAFLEAQIAQGNTKREKGRAGGPLTAGKGAGSKSSANVSGEKGNTSATGRSTPAHTILSAPTTTRKSMDIGSTSSRPQTPVNVPSSGSAQSQEKAEASPSVGTTAAGGGWGSSWWSSASAALQQARSVADQGYKAIQEASSQVVSQSGGDGEGEGDGALASAEGQHTSVTSTNTGGVRGDGESGEIKLPQLPGFSQLSEMVGKRGNLPLPPALKERVDQLRQAGAGALKQVDLEKLRHDILQRGQTAITDIINTVAPPISEHEVLQIWLSHDMKGYYGVENVVHATAQSILEQHTSTGVETFHSVPQRSSEERDRKYVSPDDEQERSLNPAHGWEEASSKTQRMLQEIQERAMSDPRKGQPHPDLPVTTIPIYLHLQPVLVSLPFSVSSKPSDSSSEKKDNHLAFLIALEDPTHSISRRTVSQFCPGDWLEVEYERSDWVENRLVEIFNAAVGVILQEYVAVRMGLKSSPSSTEVQGSETTTEEARTKGQSSEEKAAASSSADTTEVPLTG